MYHTATQKVAVSFFGINFASIFICKINVKDTNKNSTFAKQKLEPNASYTI